jgi:hypothetical protein
VRPPESRTATAANGGPKHNTHDKDSAGGTAWQAPRRLYERVDPLGILLLATLAGMVLLLVARWLR